ncbi:hypothetical protein OVS_01670 [Mycoplasma ovis str. Michigan]|uniref:Uncharacterized protein n=1 Tax=Mycoplasma ovis str. Michigan TaxID=1415773 RepID=A0ABM5P196_9MOLU|nr:hypothetical protein [Mycoplasma ovis]AHC40222.1 hypothetical protein OVS_01670 [Mycoplasma ovis str. Michigan]
MWKINPKKRAKEPNKNTKQMKLADLSIVFLPSSGEKVKLACLIRTLNY